MLFVKKEEQIHLRILTAIVLIAGIFCLLNTPDQHFIKDAVVEGQNQIEVNMTDTHQIEVSAVKQTGKISPDHVYLNESPLEALMICPGIGRQKANSIISERTIRPFSDWRDVQDRIKSISKIQIQVLQDAGVKLNSYQKESF